MSGRLDGQRVLVTGGASGLGSAIVERCVAEGAQVGVLDLSEPGLAALKDQYGEAVVVTRGDVRALTDNQQAVTACVERFGGLDGVVGNAGIWDYNLSLVNMPEDKLADAFDELFQVNVLGYLNLAKAALAELTKSKGSVVYTVSQAGFMPAGGGPLYTATKHAVVGLVRQLAFELAPFVRVNGVAPGPISTQLKGPASLGMEARKFPGEAMEQNAHEYVPIGQMATPAEYAGAFVFFLSREDNVPATGTVLNHDGGFGIRGIAGQPRGGDALKEKLGLE